MREPNELDQTTTHLLQHPSHNIHHGYSLTDEAGRLSCNRGVSKSGCLYGSTTHVIILMQTISTTTAFDVTTLPINSDR